jgi:hypothetical protein
VGPADEEAAWLLEVLRKLRGSGALSKNASRRELHCAFSTAASLSSLPILLFRGTKTLWNLLNPEYFQTYVEDR